MKIALSDVLPLAFGFPSLAVGLLFHAGVVSGILIGFGLTIFFYFVVIKKG